MVSDALALARSKEKPLTAVRFRIGNYEFREPDYCQIKVWAEALHEKPEVIIEKLESSFCEKFFGKPLKFSVKDGAIVALLWDFKHLPLLVFKWVKGLMIREIAFQGSPETPPQLSLRLPSLVRLSCSDINLTELDLSNVVGLTQLQCSRNTLNEINLSNVPGLTVLWCTNNQFSELDLSNVARLTNLSCSSNQLTELDLSNVVGLTDLQCEGNLFTKLDIRLLDKLADFRCDSFVAVKKHATQIFKK
jgi:hypothetical protein